MKTYFCQNHNLKWRRFDDLDEARVWLAANGGGTIKKHLPPEKITSFNAARRMVVVETVVGFEKGRYQRREEKNDGYPESIR